VAEDIEKFAVSGAVKDLGHLINKQFAEEAKIKKQMAKKSFVQVLDITPVVETSYDQKKECFYYTITMYGVKVDNAEEYEGWLAGRLIKSTVLTKLNRLWSR
jgi:hypothetical protein